MKQLCSYRDNSYFNDDDYFLMYDPSLKKLYINKVERNNGGMYYSKYVRELEFSTRIWYNRGPSEFKMTSIPCVNYTELIGLKLKYKGTGLTGKLTHRCVLNSIGMFWDKHLVADDYKKWGFPQTWVDPNYVEVVK